MGKEKNGEKWRIFEAQERHVSVLGAPLLNTMDWFGCFYVGRLLWRSRDERGQAPFSGEDFSYSYSYSYSYS
jgi:hypothetical protein